jgi:hypothetical protein
MTNMGYIVVRKPEFVGEYFDDAPRELKSARYEQIQYRGLCRDPWWDLNGLFYDGKLSEDEKALKRTISDARMSFFHAGICNDLDSAQKALLISNKDREKNEIIFIFVGNNLENLPRGAELLGFDFYLDGWGSVVRLGIFTKPEAFRDTIEVINPNGLFDSEEDLRIYLDLYSTLCEDENLEIIEREKMSRPLFSVYRVVAHRAD